jgi:hypothetical protein
VAIVQYDDRPTETMEPGLVRLMQLNEAYCRHHGYTYLFYDRYVPSENNPTGAALAVSPYWAKVFIVRDILREGDFDHIVWLDTDAVINHLWLGIPAFFRWATLAKPHAVLAVSEDPPEWYAPHNAGVWVARRTPNAVAFFNGWLRHYDRAAWTRNARGAWKCLDPVTKKACAWAGLKYEQGAMSLLDERFIARLPWTVLANFDYNSMGDSRAFAMHFMGEFRSGMYDYLAVRDTHRWPSAPTRIRKYAPELHLLEDTMQRVETGRVPAPQRLFLKNKTDTRRFVERLRHRADQIHATIANIRDNTR